jgi:hypothetical protein
MDDLTELSVLSEEAHDAELISGKDADEFARLVGDRSVPERDRSAPDVYDRTTPNLDAGLEATVRNRHAPESNAAEVGPPVVIVNNRECMSDQREQVLLSIHTLLSDVLLRM